MSLFGRIDRATRTVTAAVYGDPMRITPRRRQTDVNAKWIADETRVVIDDATGIYSHLPVASNEPEARDVRADRRPGTSQAHHQIEITDLREAGPVPIDVKVGDIVEMLEGDGLGRWYVGQTSPSDVGGLLLSVNRMD